MAELPLLPPSLTNDLLLRHILARSSECIKVIDIQGRLVFMNEGGLKAMVIDDFAKVEGCLWTSFWTGTGLEHALQGIAEAKAGQTSRFQAFAATMDGNERLWDVDLAPLNGVNGSPAYLLVISRDITETHKAEKVARRNEQHLRFAMSAGRLGYWELDLKSMTLTASAHCKANFGYGTDAEFTYETLMAAIHPEDFLRVQESVRHCIASGEEYDVEYRIVLPSGETEWIMVRGKTETDASGEIAGMFGISLNITERKISEERQRLLAFEVSHRMKNTLSLVQAIANQTIRTADSLEAAKRAFDSRLVALGKAQDILTETGWEAAPLKTVVVAALQPHGFSPERFAIEGPEIKLSAQSALALSLTMNELATNATKYGALAAINGGVSIEWSVDGYENDEQFRFVWKEHGGSDVKEPVKKGFGSLLIQRALSAYIGGSATLNYERSGVVFTLQTAMRTLN